MLISDICFCHCDKNKKQFVTMQNTAGHTLMDRVTRVTVSFPNFVYKKKRGAIFLRPLYMPFLQVEENLGIIFVTFVTVDIKRVT